MWLSDCHFVITWLLGFMYRLEPSLLILYCLIERERSSRILPYFKSYVLGKSLQGVELIRYIHKVVAQTHNINLTTVTLLMKLMWCLFSYCRKQRNHPKNYIEFKVYCTGHTGLCILYNTAIFQSITSRSSDSNWFPNLYLAINSVHISILWIFFTQGCYWT